VKTADRNLGRLRRMWRPSRVDGQDRAGSTSRCPNRARAQITRMESEHYRTKRASNFTPFSLTPPKPACYIGGSLHGSQFTPLRPRHSKWA
jgi:hypothetical protein